MSKKKLIKRFILCINDPDTKETLIGITDTGDIIVDNKVIEVNTKVASRIKGLLGSDIGEMGVRVVDKPKVVRLGYIKVVK